MTARLRGLPLTEGDLADLVELHQDPRVLAPFGVEASTPDETAIETREWLEWRLDHWREHGFGVWMFRDPDGLFVGRCGIHRWSLDGQSEVELGYVVRSDLWSHGYATEMGGAVVDHAFSALGMPTLVGFTRRTNISSCRVLEKLGFVYERSFTTDGKSSVLYRLASSSPRP